MITWRRPVFSSAAAKPGSAPHEKCIFTSGGPGSTSLSSGIVSPRPFGYCSVAITGIPSSFAAPTSARPYLTTRASASSGIAGASRDWTSTTSTTAFVRSSFSLGFDIAVSSSSDGVACCSAGGGGLGIDLHVDAVDRPRGEGALERGDELPGVLDVLALPAERLHDPVVPRGREPRRDGVLLAVQRALRDQDLPPRGVVPDHHDHREPEPHGGLVVHPVEAERPVPLHDADGPLRREQL